MTPEIMPRDHYEREALGLVFTAFNKALTAAGGCTEAGWEWITPYYEQGQKHERVQQLADTMEAGAKAWANVSSLITLPELFREDERIEKLMAA